MAGEWPLVQLGDISDLFDGPHQTAPLTGDGPVVYLNVGDIRGARIELQLSGRVSEETARSWSRRVVPEAGDVVFGYEATLGHAAVLSSAHRWCLGRRVGLLRPRSERVDPRFLAYSWYSPRFQETLRANRVGGSTIESIRLTDLPAWHIALPNLDEQRAIAHILGTLDDKIELNRRMNETLETIARALFKSWFVDFDPVRAKSEGRDPGLPPHLADLFPDSFQDSVLGEIPKGWLAGKAGELAEVVRNTCTPGDFPVEAFDHFSIPAFDQERRPKVENGESIKSNKFLVPAESVLVSKLNPRIPRIWMPTLEGSHRAVCSTEFLVTLPRAGVSREFLFCLFSSDAFASVFETLVNGTSGSHQRVRPEGFLAMDVAIPGEEVVRQFTNAVRPTLERVDRTRAESDSLVALRDTLLPRLVAGDLRVC